MKRSDERYKMLRVEQFTTARLRRYLNNKDVPTHVRNHVYDELLRRRRACISRRS